MRGEELLQIKERREAELLKIKGVTGVGTRNARIVIYVEEATPEVLAAIPTSIEDIPVMVRVTGPIRILAISPLSLEAMTAAKSSRYRPVPGGVSIGDPTVTAGTLGFNTFDFKILSNAHVLGINYETGGWNSPGTPVTQPGPYDGGTLADRIGELERVVEIKPEESEEENLIDAAIGRPDSPLLVSHEILEVGGIYGWTDPVPDAFLEKSGRSTCRKGGRIFDVNATVRVQGYPGGAAIFKDQIMFENPDFSVIAPGDSGSLAYVLIGGLPYAVGLCFAGSPIVGVANKMSNVVSLLGVDVGPYTPGPPPTIPAWWDTVRILGVAAGPVAIGALIGSEEARKGFQSQGGSF